jgi:hypothetical protein
VRANCAWTSIDLSVNSFSGPIPLEIERCVHLTLLRLSRNQLSGSVELLNLTAMVNLTTLDVSGNPFGSPLPSLLPLYSLVALDLSNCGFTGSFTARWHDVVYNMQVLRLGGNRISGSIVNTHRFVPRSCRHGSQRKSA